MPGFAGDDAVEVRAKPEPYLNSVLFEGRAVAMGVGGLRGFVTP